MSARTAQISAPECPSQKSSQRTSSVTIAPPSPLAYKKTYTVYVPKGAVKDKGGNPLENAYTFNFTTETAPTPKTFSDIQEHWAQKDIETMAGLGIVKGITEDTFGPEHL